MHVWPEKDPNEVLDFRFDWTARLESGETITTSTIIVESGDVVVNSSSVAGGIVTVWLSGGTDTTTSVLTSRIVTSAARTYDESARLRIKSSTR